MSTRSLLACILTACLLAACGGSVRSDSPRSERLLATSGTAPLVFAGVRSDYAITATATGYAVTALAGSGGAASVPRDARLRFADISLAFDLDGTAGKGFRLYRAAFARTPDAAGLGYWIARMDAGASVETVAGEFITSAEFKALYGDQPGDAELVDRLYRNVLHRAGEPAGVAYWIGVLDRGGATRAQVLGWFSESAENKAGVQQGIAGGISYLEAGVPYVPRADPGPGRIVDLAQPVTLDGGASTVAVGKPIRYAWRFGAKPAGSAAVLAQAESVHPSFVPDVDGQYDVELVVSDGLASSRAVTATVVAAWRPADGQAPASGNFVHLQSDAGDQAGGGATYTYTQADAELRVSADGPRLHVSIRGDEEWLGGLALPASLGKLQAGYYGGLGPSSDTDPAKGNVSLSRSGHECVTDGWILVDRATYDGDTLVALDVRFGQHCDGAAPVLHGQVHWTPDDGTRPAGPVPVPAPPARGSWQPPPGATPASGSYVYLFSEAGDYVGDGKTYLFTGANAALEVTGTGAHATLRITEPDGSWQGDLEAMSSVARLVPGYYADIRQWPRDNPARGGLDWSGHGRVCNTASGWFAVDQVTYVNGVIISLDLRFVQHCNDSVPVIHGKMHWAAG